MLMHTLLPQLPNHSHYHLRPYSHLYLGLCCALAWLPDRVGAEASQDLSESGLGKVPMRTQGAGVDCRQEGPLAGAGWD